MAQLPAGPWLCRSAWNPKCEWPLRRASGGQGVGRARDVVRGQDGHDDGSNMMRMPNRRLSVPVSKDLKEGGCA